MKKLYLLILLTFAYTASAITTPDLTGVRAPTSTDLNLDGADKYKAKSDNSYQGRNLNSARAVEASKSNESSSISRSIATSASKKQAQMENLESTAGEFIQKLEEDRFRKAKEHESIYKQAKDNYTNAYTNTKKIDIDNLGNEQDPYIQNAFKCKDLNNCSRGDSDPHAVPTCNDTQVLHWTGTKWQCLNQFIKPESANCSADQWSKPINNGTACVDYIYLWGETGVGACQKNGRADIIYSCMKKKTPTDTGTVTSASSCKASKPVGTKACTYYGVWKAGSWGSCSKSCGGGTKTRSVTCSAIECTGSKPAIRTSCNTQACTASWSVGGWGSCSKSCGGGTKTRSVTCPSGYVCNGAKPATSTSCNTQSCGSSSCGGARCSGGPIVVCKAGTSTRCTYVSGMNGCHCTYKSSNPSGCKYNPITRTCE